jgi:4-diphosphocytidyl-2-C-methyl-D-erythritol kinase
MVVFPNAKINIGLNILRKRNDSFHDIESIFYPIPLYDVLEIQKNVHATKITLVNTGYTVDTDVANNLCVKAFQVLQTEYKLPNVDLYLHKAIPFGAGLGGGSSDAAFTIALLNNLFELKLSKETMKSYAAKIGSDCAFFIDNVPSLAEGRGEILNPINIDLKGWYLVLVKPEVHVSTTNAYSRINPKIPVISVSDLISLPVSRWKDKIVNDFEDHILKQFPILGSIKEKLYNMGAVYASMSGSGSTIYGLFEKDIDLYSHFSDCFVWKKQL